MNDTYESIEKRKFARAKAEFILSYRINKSVEMHMWVGSEEVSAVMLDLSETGMAILTKFNIPVATVLLLKFTLINFSADEDNRLRTIEMSAQVRNNIPQDEGEHRLGIVFTKISKKDKQAITDFVQTTK